MNLPDDDFVDSAAYYNGAYWFVPDGAAAAARIDFTYTNGIPTGIASIDKYDFDDPPDMYFWRDSYGCELVPCVGPAVLRWLIRPRDLNYVQAPNTDSDFINR